MRSLLRDPVFIILAAVGVVALIWLAVTLLVRSGSQGGGDHVADAISRDELIAGYFALVPDGEATRADVVDLADLACEQLGSGTTVNQVADTFVESGMRESRAEARQVLQLLVSYGCAEYLDAFE